MLDIQYIKNHATALQEVADQKKISISIAELLEKAQLKNQYLQQIEQLRQQRNQLTQTISSHMQNKSVLPTDTVHQLKDQVKQINLQLQQLEQTSQSVQQQYARLMELVPNYVSPDTPIGQSDADNIVIRTWGTPQQFAFPFKDHIELGEIHQMIDITRGVKTAGSRNYYLTGAGALLHRAVQQLALDTLLAKGYTPMEVPTLVRGSALSNTAFFPLGIDQTFKIENEDKWLTGTSEVALVSYYQDEIIDLSQGAIRLAAVSQNFRSEVGSTGKDVRGLYRVHQFAKVEQVIFCEANAEISEQIHQEITANAEELLQLLELPYQVVAVCTGDMSQKTYKQYDIETWMPSRQSYGETHSSSNIHDFQARRANIRYRDHEGQLQYCHTLNNTAVASPRILIPLLENHQREDGSIYIPVALRPYLNHKEQL
ncbi:seryl-tRNA synthetase [Paenibacillus sp. SORGH_AS306]|uniref:serine--tRNA ligase n=1 Tax=unclassified Paenibacillus TaxID=185978 RepID=UPI002780733F|nr:MULTISPECIES: serine--tRNA ligase [unclassified Paenibacillus]MDQ1235796.1 seryl-tRNA synthetase [Paenibacillus sp. SORGH_AS_0306]MDR6112845.1 seryl-tRNA synthetase [Paenibacillus sp. SORGH_AS_0338]